MSELKAVTSSMLTHVGHDADSGRLTVIFKNGGTYHYEGVSTEEHAALLGAPSIGVHFSKHIRDNKRASKA